MCVYTTGSQFNVPLCIHNLIFYALNKLPFLFRRQVDEHPQAYSNHLKLYTNVFYRIAIFCFWFFFFNLSTMFLPLIKGLCNRKHALASINNCNYLASCMQWEFNIPINHLRTKPHDTVEQLICRVVGKASPSIRCYSQKNPTILNRTRWQQTWLFSIGKMLQRKKRWGAGGGGGHS